MTFAFDLGQLIKRMVKAGPGSLRLLPLLFLLNACGGGGSSGDAVGGGLSARALWQQPTESAPLVAAAPLQQAGADRFGPELPAAARTVRFVFSPTGGDACCVAVDPRSIPLDPDLQQRVLVLTQLPVGAGSLTISAFPTDFAPAPGGIAATCSTRPAGVGGACDQTRAQSPSFSSDAQDVNIRVGTDTDAGDILIRAFPFIVPNTLRPGVNEEAFNPVAAAVTIADAVSGVDSSSVRLDLRSNGAAVPEEMLQLTACDDAGELPCSEGGALQVKGFAVVRPAQELAPGGGEVRIGARNLAMPPRRVDVSSRFTVLGSAPTMTERPTGTATRPPSATSTATVPRTPTTVPSTRTRTPLPSRTPSPTRRVTSTPTRALTPTSGPTVSPTIIFAGAEPITVSARPDFLVSADFNRDGNVDLAVISPLSEEMNVLLGAGDSPSRFSPVTVYRFGERLRQPTVGDLNADGNPDVVVPDSGSSGVWIVLGKGDGTFLPPSLLPVGTAPFAVAVADFDGRPGEDLAVADRQRNSVFLLLSSGTDPLEFSFGPELLAGANPEEIVAVDLNRDGHADLATVTVGGEATLGVLLWEGITQNGSPLFANVVSYDAGDRPAGLAVADLNGDGGEDLILLSRPTGDPESNLLVYLSRGDGSIEALDASGLSCPFATSNPCPSRGLVAADFEQDGKIDLAVAMVDPRGSSRADMVRVLRGRGDGVFLSGPFFPTAEDVMAISAGDYTGDGPIDLAVSSVADINVQALVNISVLASGGN